MLFLLNHKQFKSLHVPQQNLIQTIKLPEEKHVEKEINLWRILST